MTVGAAHVLTTLPLVGRAPDVNLLTGALDEAEAGRGRTVFLVGEGGVGKTRVVRALAEVAARRGWSVAAGQAYPVETGVPYALFSDAFLPIIRKLDASALQVLTRGGSAELLQLFPALAASAPPDRAAGRGDPAEVKARLLWNFSQFVGRLAAKQPLLVVLENLQWADASSLELLHFTARQIGKERVLIVCSYAEEDRDRNPTLRTTETSLISLGAARAQRLDPLSRASTEELVQQIFGAERAATREFTALLYGWTRGNPFFVEETLKSLVESGRLHERDGTWLGWEIAELNLPRSIRDAVVARMDRLGADARQVANLAAVIGTRASYEALRSVAGLPEEQLTALDELRHQRILLEDAEGDEVGYDFAHPILRDTLSNELGRARARVLHAAVAQALESFYGPRATEHSDELAYHFSRADARSLAPKAVKYLAAAGARALAHAANREAANYLSSALDLVDRGDAGTETGVETGPLVDDLARARQRLGEYDSALRLWERAKASAAAAGDQARIARIERRIGLASYWSGSHTEALERYDAGLVAARRAGDDGLYAQIRLAKGMCLQGIGRAVEARGEVLGALAIAERLGDKALLGRVHRGLTLLYVWTGPADLAREHGALAIALADESGDKLVSWSAHWAMAMLEGLTGHAPAISEHVAEANRLADELRSPVLRLWSSEVEIEYLSGIGDWDAGIALGERTIALARTLRQRMLLPRILVWTGIMYLGRGDLDRAKRYFDEAWTLSGAGEGVNRPFDVHTVVPAHTGMACYYLAISDYRRAIRIGEQGVAIAERTGDVVWAIHRLTPAIGEAALWLADFERAQRVGERLRRESERFGQKLGLAWADACNALVAMLKPPTDAERAISLMRNASDELDAIPFVEHGARMRRQLALLLARTGDREGATRELRRVHDIFARLGAERELNLTREQLRELGARPPARVLNAGVAGLTGREVDIARLVAERKSNKEIGKALGISPRTVSTHLSNIFGKLNVGSRGELTDVVRQGGLPAAE